MEIDGVLHIRQISRTGTSALDAILCHTKNPSQFEREVLPLGRRYSYRIQDPDDRTLTKLE